MTHRQRLMVGAAAAALLSVSAIGPACAGSVRVVRGDHHSPTAPGTVETVSFPGAHTPAVRVVRGGGGWLPAALARDRVLAAPPLRDTGGVSLVAFADPHENPVTVLRGSVGGLTAAGPSAPQGAFDLDRLAFAIDGAESSHGTDPGMWRLELDGPQGPMQVSAAAALDAGGGDRFDLDDNRALGRAYLERLYRRYGNWSDAVAAYNWGPGNLDAWIAGGRTAAGLPPEVEHYRDRVLSEGGGLPRLAATKN